MDPALIFFFGLQFENLKCIKRTIPNNIQSKNPKYYSKCITNTIQNYQMYPTIKIFLSFLAKKNRAGGILRERGLGTYTSPSLRI